jgi:hypothetical protein
VDGLRQFVNVADDNAWRLLVAWLVQALRPRGPYPVLCLSGEHGSAKTTAARMVRSLIDPNLAPLRKEPREDRDLLIAATNAWLVAFDNLSALPAWLSDALCRLATGGGFATRELYTDAEEMLFDAMRPCMLTSIEDLATRGDLLDRCILQNLPAIPDDRRRPERVLWSEFEAARPRILGALLGAAAGALRELPRVNLQSLPRLADFAEWATAAGGALGWPDESFLKAYRDNRAGANELALEADVLVPPLLELLGEKGSWEGTATALLQALTEKAGEAAARAPAWPGRPNVLSGRLRRLAPSLRAAGWVVDKGGTAGGRRGRSIRIAKDTRNGAAPGSVPSFPPSPPSREGENPGAGGGSAERSGTMGTIGNDARNDLFAGKDAGNDGNDVSAPPFLPSTDDGGGLYTPGGDPGF